MHRLSLSSGVSAPAFRLPRTVRRRGRLLARLAVLLPLGAAGLAAQALATAPGAHAAPTTATFTYTGAQQTYTIPAGATALTITAIGAPGGTEEYAGGLGADVTATVPTAALPAGTTTLYVEVGGVGQGSFSCSINLGGFNGGGTGDCDNGGGGGGGASDVRTTSIVTVPDSTLTTANDSRLVVAGGGGGGGANGKCAIGTPPDPGGRAGDTTVSGAGNGGTFCTTGGNGGFGGAGGGVGGVSGVGPPGPNGSLGQGGGGSSFGGGGGGGYYGGGGGGEGDESGGGGGAGSSFWVAGAVNTSMSEDTTGVPEVTITPFFGPVIGKLRPDHGPTFGGTLVEITGAGLACPRYERSSCRVSVTFGSHRAFVLFASPTAIWVIAPPGHGTVQVTVTVGGVSSQATTTGLFTYRGTRFLP
jgi:hypothetical protein